MKKTRKITAKHFEKLLDGQINSNRNIQTLLLAHMSGDPSLDHLLSQDNCYVRLVFPEGFSVEIGLAEMNNALPAKQEPVEAEEVEA